jgi:Flp pilus assembly secretin CpaC
MRSHCGRVILWLFAAALTCQFAAATTAFAADETIDVIIDFAKVRKLDEPAHTIIIGNPGIADVSVNDDTMLVLTGKTAGTTNLIVLDEAGDEILEANLRVSSDIQELTTVFYGSQRQTFSCSPVCEQVISVGDSEGAFSRATTQIQTRRDFSTGQ